MVDIDFFRIDCGVVVLFLIEVVESGFSLIESKLRFEVETKGTLRGEYIKPSAKVIKRDASAVLRGAQTPS
jgi:hypothetical protein